MTAGVERERAAGVKVGRWGRGHSLASDELQLVKVKATEWPRCTIFCRLLYLEASLPLQQAESLTAHPVHLPSQVCERYGQPNAMFSLKDHTALVTGGTRGIGQAVAIALAEAGADVILVQVPLLSMTETPSLELGLTYHSEKCKGRRDSNRHPETGAQSYSRCGRPQFSYRGEEDRSRATGRGPGNTHTGQLRRHPTAVPLRGVPR